MSELIIVAYSLTEMAEMRYADQYISMYYLLHTTKYFISSMKSILLFFFCE